MKTLNRILVMVSLALPALVDAQFSFTTNNSAITITGYTGSGGAVTIPAKTNGYPVTSIADYAFRNCTSVSSMTIPTSVTSLGNFTFENCTGLKSVTIPNSVTNIGNTTFGSCTNLSTLTIPGSVTSIGDAAFHNCTSLKTLTIPSGVKSIGDNAFNATTSVKTVSIPNTLTSIGDAAFGYCSSLTNVTIPSSVSSIGASVFASCSKLTNITVSTSNQYYSSTNGVLFDKARKTLIQFPVGRGGSYSIPGTVTSIADSGFGFCSSLTSVTIPNSVTSIGYSAFGFCSRLSSVTIPNSVTTIGDYAFNNCSALTSVTIPNQVTSIGNYAFFFCTNLTSAYFQGNAPPDNGNAFYVDPATVYYLPGTTGWGPTFGSVPTMPWMLVANQAGFTSGKFGFSLNGPANSVVVVEACTNLTHPVWLPIATNSFSISGAAAFSDSQSGSRPSRFYRVHMP